MLVGELTFILHWTHNVDVVGVLASSSRSVDESLDHMDTCLMAYLFPLSNKSTHTHWKPDLGFFGWSHGIMMQYSIISCRRGNMYWQNRTIKKSIVWLLDFQGRSVWMKSFLWQCIGPEQLALPTLDTNAYQGLKHHVVVEYLENWTMITYLPHFYGSTHSNRWIIPLKDNHSSIEK